MYLYLVLLIISIFFPLILSFDRKVQFYRIWNSLFPAIIIVGSVYITADIFFVRMGIWGFNPEYHIHMVLLGLPIEEWLFFIVIPYSCIFIHYVFISYFPDLVLNAGFTRLFTVILIIFLLSITVLNYNKAYTVFNFSLLILALIFALFDKSRLLNSYYFSFLIILVPFFIVNGILTGTFIPGEVVWYNNSEILGLRLLTVPVEDIGYAFSLILLNLLLINRFKSIHEKA